MDVRGGVDCQLPIDEKHEYGSFRREFVRASILGLHEWLALMSLLFQAEFFVLLHGLPHFYLFVQVLVHVLVKLLPFSF